VAGNLIARVSVTYTDRKQPYVQNKMSDNIDNKSKGLGDTIKKVTDKLGIKQCGKCKKRQEKLNKMFPYKTEQHRKNHMEQLAMNRKTAVEVIQALRGENEPKPSSESVSLED
jgi:hypothetical protein